jgi:hypothetical protein
MAKKQTRRSISVSRTTYERLKAFCEANNISMSQLVETRVNDFLGETSPSMPAPRPAPSVPPRPQLTMTPRVSTVVPMTSAAARFAVEPPPPIIKPRQQEPAPKPAEKRPDQIFTF